MAEAAVLTDDQKRIKIAEACGWTEIALPWGIPPGNPEHDSRNPLFHVPDYLNDLNAMHEAESLLGEHQVTEYVTHLRGMLYHRSWLGCFGVHATAAQRADAFLLTVAEI